jgi:hypothetical protein
MRNNPMTLPGTAADNAGLIDTALREGRMVILESFQPDRILISVTPPRTHTHSNHQQEPEK